MADADYRIAPIFLIRMAGVPFEAIEKLATPQTKRAGGELVERQVIFCQAKSQVEGLLSHLKKNLTKKQFYLWRKAIRSGRRPADTDPVSNAFAACWHDAEHIAAAESHLDAALVSEINSTRDALFDGSRQFLPAYLVFAASGVRERLIHQLSGAPNVPRPRNKQARADERHLLLYLQRVAAKNDSLSQFGPEGWGVVSDQIASLAFAPQPGIARRETFLERWTAHGVAAAINSDQEAILELSPRLHPTGRLEAGRFVFTETGESLPLDPETTALLARCNGATPAYSLGVNPEALVRLAQQNLILWAMEVPALEPNAFDVLLADVSCWRDGAARDRWLSQLQPLAELPDRFARTADPLSRLAIINEATAHLEKLGAHKTATRFLYAATNPIGEECFRECHFAINEELINQVVREAAPWIDLWRDNFAFVASRVAAGLGALLDQLSLQGGAVPLPAFARHCAEAKLPLTGPGLVALAHLAFREVKAAFAENLAARANEADYELSAADCHFVRRQFEYEKFDEFTYPSADLQLGAHSLGAIARGDYQWVLAELHPPAALLHHGFFWACPDPAVLADALAQTVGGKPSFHFGFFAADFTATTTVRLFDGLPDNTFFVAPQRGHPAWRVIPPPEVEVYRDLSSGDVGLRTRGAKEYLGSFARAWIIPLGFHPFSFSLGAHTPRLRCGSVVVQRESWTVAAEELGTGNFAGVSRDLVVAVERLRAARRLPRYVYIRPSEQALRRSGAEGRDKDTKPVYIDFESYLFLEIFHRWLMKAGELEITEMLPTPDQLFWQEPDGRRSFELRTLILPR